MSDFELERYRQAAEGRAGSPPAPGGRAAWLGRVAGPANEIQVGRFIRLEVVRVMGSEMAGQAGAFTNTGVFEWAYLVGPAVPAVGDHLVVFDVAHRWVTERQSSVAPCTLRVRPRYCVGGETSHPAGGTFQLRQGGVTLQTGEVAGSDTFVDFPLTAAGTYQVVGTVAGAGNSPLTTNASVLTCAGGNVVNHYQVFTRPSTHLCCQVELPMSGGVPFRLRYRRQVRQQTTMGAVIISDTTQEVTGTLAYHASVSIPWSERQYRSGLDENGQFVQFYQDFAGTNTFTNAFVSEPIDEMYDRQWDNAMADSFENRYARVVVDCNAGSLRWRWLSSFDSTFCGPGKLVNCTVEQRAVLNGTGPGFTGLAVGPPLAISGNLTGSNVRELTVGDWT